MQLRMLTADWFAAQQKLMVLTVMGKRDRCARSTDPNPDAVVFRKLLPPPMDDMTRRQWEMAVFTQTRECQRCGLMLAVNFQAANDEGGEAPTAA